MGNITQLKQGSLSGLRRQTNECLDSAYNKGYEDGAKNQDEVQYQKGYNKGLEDGRAEATYNTDLIDELKQVEYIRGLEDVNHAIDVLKDMTVEECEEWFEDCNEIGDVVCTFTVQQIIEITKAYEEKKKAEEEIKVGDEIKSVYDNKLIGIVTKVNCQSGKIRILFSDGSGGILEMNPKDYKRTGRNFSAEIEQLLDKLRGEEE